MEMLYGCGLRVTELVTLRIGDLFFEEGYVRVVGKGDKQRLVPGRRRGGPVRYALFGAAIQRCASIRVMPRRCS